MLVKLLAFSLLLVPLADGSGWRALNFGGVTANTVGFGTTGIMITVDHSASPLIHQLPKGTRVSRLEISGIVTGELNIPKDGLWQKGFDDAFLRVGVVERGEERLSGVRRGLAPEWLRQIDGFLGAVGAVRSVQLMPRPEWKGRSRVNPEMKLFHERVAGAPDKDGKFHIVAEFDPPLNAAGLWVQADGDDTGSAFRVVVDKLVVSGPER